MSETRNSSSGPGGNPASIMARGGKKTCHEGSMVAGSCHAIPFHVSSNQRVLLAAISVPSWKYRCMQHYYIQSLVYVWSVLSL